MATAATLTYDATIPGVTSPPALECAAVVTGCDNRFHHASRFGFGITDRVNTTIR